MRIVAIDDAPEIRLIIKRIFEKAMDADVICFDEGQSALEFLEKHAKSTDIIFCDIMMQGMDGMTFLEHAHEKWPFLPIIMVTSRDDKETIKKALRLGAADYIEKPFEKKQIIEATEKILKNSVRKDYENILSINTDLDKAQKMIITPPCTASCKNIQYRYRPLLSAGGDFFSCRTFSDGSCGIIIADVSGHDIKSSYIAAEFKGILISVWDDHPDPVELLTILNEKILASGFSPAFFVCAKTILWNRYTGILKIANAGMPHGVLCSPNHSCSYIELNGTSLGFVKDPVFENSEITLSSGDRLVFFSDGISDNFEYNSLPEIIQNNFSPSLVQTADTLMNTFSSSNFDIKDDMLVVLLEQPVHAQTNSNNTLRIMSVDDDIYIHTILRQILAFPEFELDTCSDVMAASRLLNQKKYDLILLDISMSWMTGDSFMRILKSNNLSIPVVFLTSKSSETDRRTGMELGAADYIVKPFEPENLKQRIRSVIQKFTGQSPEF